MDTHMPALRHLMDAKRIERAQLARVVQLQAIDALMKALEILAAHGFCAIGFAHPDDGFTTVKVEAPSDLMVDALRKLKPGAIGGRFSSEANQRWFMFGDTRVLWDVQAEEVRS